VICSLLADGDVTLSTVTLLAAHLTDENHEALIDTARRKSKRDVERLVASLVPQPNIASSLRRLPAARAVELACLLDESAAAGRANDGGIASDRTARREQPPTSGAPQALVPAHATRPAASRPVVAPLASDRYLLRVTLGAEAHARLDRARDLLRHAVPTGDLAVIIDRALAALVERLERSRRAANRRSQARPRATARRRHVPAAVRCAVWARDDGRCAFVGADGRCLETGWLELHHVVPFARGGPATAANLELRCRAHNAYEAEREFGARVPVGGRKAQSPAATLSGQSSSGEVSK
jgi:5-methylcytosine-specific restriction endonuclease McrA